MYVSIPVELTPSKYLDAASRTYRNHLYFASRQSEVALTLMHDSSNEYDEKAIKVLYKDTFIGYIRKRYLDEDLSGFIEKLCFEDDQLKDDARLVCSDGEYSLMGPDE